VTKNSIIELYSGDQKPLKKRKNNQSKLATTQNKMKKLVLIKYCVLLFIGISIKGNCQEDFFSMKGSYIYYNFDEVTNNTKHCIMHYSSYMDSSGQINASSTELMVNVQKKCQNLNEIKLTLVGLKETMVNFMVPTQMTANVSCTGEISSGTFFLTLPTGAILLENNLLFSLFTAGKFKVSGQMITATVKVKFESKNKYSLIISNFKIKYIGTQGTKLITEEINLEEVYTALQEKGKLDGKMYDKCMTSMRELDKIIKSCAKIYSEELKRTYEIDEL
jgi:hypothetical protein